jgi:hypothetical protein
MRTTHQANARFAAEYLFEAAISGDDGHMARARQAVLDLADHAAFGEMVISELALLGLTHNRSCASSYLEAEAAARRAVARLIPQLAGLAEPHWGRA